MATTFLTREARTIRDQFPSRRSRSECLCSHRHIRWVGCFGQTLSTWATHRAWLSCATSIAISVLRRSCLRFIIKRREIGVELPATRKYFCPKMREPNLIFGSFKNPSRDALKRCCGTEATAVFDLRVFLSREPETHVFDSLASFLPVHIVFARACTI